MLSSRRSKTSKLTPVANATSHNPSASHSAEIIASNDDLLNEILLRLPIKALLKFKSISKHWLFLISNQKFSIRRCPYPASASGLFLERPGLDFSVPKFDFADLNSASSTSSPQSLSCTNDISARSGFRILQSCNSLFLCCSRSTDVGKKYCVYNPTTKHCARLPGLESDYFINYIESLALAFDLSISPHYKVLCLRSDLENSRSYIDIYCSNAANWRRSTQVIFPVYFKNWFDQVVFWNGSVHWIRRLHTSLYFNVYEERLCEMPMPPIPENFETSHLSLGYFGESRGHFHYVEHRHDPVDKFFNVYELERDYSKWFLKYRIDVTQLLTAFQEITPVLFSGEVCLRHYLFSILCIVRCEVDEDSYLIMNIPEKFEVHCNRG